MVLVKKSKIFSSFVLSKVGLEIMLSYGLEKKNKLFMTIDMSIL